jgi:sporulation protein YlmC with PRC-barrel domain
LIALVNVNKIIGKQIVSSKGEILGEVEGVDVDSVTWQSNGLFVGLTKDATVELGLKKPILGHVVINLPTSLIVSVGEVITLKDSVKSLRDMVEQVKD